MTVPGELATQVWAAGGSEATESPIEETLKASEVIAEVGGVVQREMGSIATAAAVEQPSSEAEIQKLRQEIDTLDAAILAAVQRRTEISRTIGRTRMAQGGTRLVHTREMKVLDRFSDLGQEGAALGMLLLRLGRGRLGYAE
jgi:chorismate mutase